MAEYIEREALIEQFGAYFERTDPAGEEQIGVLQCRRIARLIPAADVVPKGAYDQVAWERDVAIEQLREDYGVGLGEKKRADVVKVKRGENLKLSGMFECSLCGWMDWDTMLADGRFNFCPNCGARMEVDHAAD